MDQGSKEFEDRRSYYLEKIRERMGYPEHNSSMRRVLYIKDQICYYDIRHVATTLINKWFTSEFKNNEQIIPKTEFMIAKTHQS